MDKISNSKGDTKKYTQYTQPRFENVGQRLYLRYDVAFSTRNEGAEM